MAEDSLDDGYVAPYYHLIASLETHADEHESLYRLPETEEEKITHRAIDEVSRFALEILRSGEIPAELHSSLGSELPGEELQRRVHDLLFAKYTLRRVEFDVARQVVERLDGADRRVVLAVVAAVVLARASLSLTAKKYLEQVTGLFLAGYQAEVFVMAGAVLEAAMRDRFSDEYLESVGFKPRYRRTMDFALSQRMAAEEKSPIFSDDQRDSFRRIMNWRNDVVHVQPDIVPEPSQVVVQVAQLLSVILPR